MLSMLRTFYQKILATIGYWYHEYILGLLGYVWLEEYKAQEATFVQSFDPQKLKDLVETDLGFDWVVMVKLNTSEHRVYADTRFKTLCIYDRFLRDLEHFDVTFLMQDQQLLDEITIKDDKFPFYDEERKKMAIKNHLLSSVLAHEIGHLSESLLFAGAVALSLAMLGSYMLRFFETLTVFDVVMMLAQRVPESLWSWTSALPTLFKIPPFIKWSFISLSSAMYLSLVPFYVVYLLGVRREQYFEYAADAFATSHGYGRGLRYALEHIIFGRDKDFLKAYPEEISWYDGNFFFSTHPSCDKRVYHILKALGQPPVPLVDHPSWGARSRIDKLLSMIGWMRADTLHGLEDPLRLYDLNKHVETAYRVLDLPLDPYPRVLLLRNVIFNSVGMMRAPGLLHSALSWIGITSIPGFLSRSWIFVPDKLISRIRNLEETHFSENFKKEVLRKKQQQMPGCVTSENKEQEPSLDDLQQHLLEAVLIDRFWMQQVSLWSRFKAYVADIFVALYRLFGFQKTYYAHQRIIDKDAFIAQKGYAEALQLVIQTELSGSIPTYKTTVPNVARRCRAHVGSVFSSFPSTTERTSLLYSLARATSPSFEENELKESGDSKPSADFKLKAAGAKRSGWCSIL